MRKLLLKSRHVASLADGLAMLEAIVAFRFLFLVTTI
jgi:hypothetical protein